jgi:hypothetical protein
MLLRLPAIVQALRELVALEGRAVRRVSGTVATLLYASDTHERIDQRKNRHVQEERSKSA